MIRSRVEYLLITLSDISYSSDIYIRKRHNKKVHRYERKSLSLLPLDYNRITIGLQSVASSPTSWKHTVQAVPQYTKKKKTTKGKDKRKKKEKKKKGKRDGDK